MQELIFATKNAGKVREFREFLAPLGIQVRDLTELEDLPEIVENGQTFEENALIKAQTIAEFLNQPVVAEDSGLVIDALNGEPGVHSARYAADHDDAANNAKVLERLTGFAPEKRTANFQTVIVALKPDGNKLVAKGSVHGQILDHLQGDNGFGYDPLFFYPPYNKTMAEMTAAEKNEISHRGQALKQFMRDFNAWWEA
ncbi:MAG: XTP/dITP diphosphatase [Lactobacillaceae bacterium]|jgi:XTP/dITP diphosphohydrolase|nr:XTP/dITP diphosphatase [Lactobacillaceae bacterium]